MGKSDSPFNNPFQKLKLDKPAAAKKGPIAPPAPKKQAALPESDEAALFHAHIGEVEPVRSPHNRVLPNPAPPPPRGTSEEDEALLQLSELVTGEGDFNLADSDEFIEGAAPNLDANILRKLHRGDYAVRAHLDLHGLTRAEAKTQLEVFLRTAQQQQYRCVLIVHGRGLHSKDQIPVLKESVQLWLSRGRIGRQVLAFATARPVDGGAGAVYVLLRR
jgi:DNA-nicking Smr family endonuclease